jgi:hypothetical protein
MEKIGSVARPRTWKRQSRTEVTTAHRQQCRKASAEAGKALPNCNKPEAGCASSPVWMLSRIAIIGRAGRWHAPRLPDLSLGGKREEAADRLALKIQVIERNAIGGRRDLLQAKSRRHERLELRPPIGGQRRQPLVTLRATAVAFDACVFGIQSEQRLEIALPARIQPINDYRYLVEIVRQIHRTSFLRDIVSRDHSVVREDVAFRIGLSERLSLSERLAPACRAWWRIPELP